MEKVYRTVPIGDVKPYPGNARRGNVDMIRGSLRELDQYRDIVVQESTGYILAGNHTWLGAQAEGRSDIDIAVIDVDDATARKIVLIDNKSNDEATYDPEELANLLAELEGDFIGTGFEQGDLDKMLDSMASRNEKADKLPPVPVTTDLEQGAIFKLGDHVLMCGDCLNPEHLDTLLDGETIDITVTSPPYNQKLDAFKPSGMGHDPAWSGWVQRMSEAYDDSKPEPEYQQEQVNMLDLAWERTKPGGALFYNHKVRYRDKEVLTPYLFIIRSKWQVRQEVIWNRAVTITMNARMFMPRDERIYWLTKDGADFYFANTTEVKSYGTVWDVSPRIDIPISAPYPVEIPRRCIEAGSERGGVVFEPYSGSGTTMIAAEELGRRCYSMEVNPVYVMASVSRWEAFAGMKAERID